MVINEDSDDVDFRVETNGNANMLFISGGNDVVGVGAEGDLGNALHVKSGDSGASVANEADELVVEGSADSGISILSGTGSTGSINFGDSGDNDIGRLVYNQDDNTFRFVANATEVMRIHGGTADVDKVSIGSSNAVGGLHVMYNAGDSTSQGAISITANNSGTSTGILFLDGQNQNCGRISVLGSSNEIAIFGQSSDYRLKQDIADMDSSWELIKSLKPRKFRWKDKEDLGYYNSFIAHELQEIIPKAVAGEKDAMTSVVLYTSNDTLPEGKNIGDVKEEAKIDPQQIATSELIPYLTNALKEAITKIETLEAKVKTLEEG